MKPRPLSLPGFGPLTFFRKLSAAEASAAYIVSGRWTVIAWDPVETMAGRTVQALERVKALQKKNSSASSGFPFAGGSIGWISYDAAMKSLGLHSRHQRHARLPDVCFHRYEQAVLWNGRKVFAIGNAAFRRAVAEIHARPLPAFAPTPIVWKPAVTRAEYGRGFTQIKKGIRDGDFYQLNYSYPLRGESADDPRQLFASLLAHNPASSASYLEYGQSALLSLSPERFVLMQEGRIVTCPIKGTRPRGVTPADDRRLRKELQDDPKEAAELNMITDLLRNDIGQVSETGSVRVTGHRLLQKNPSVWHTYSVIEGRLKPSVHPLDAVVSMMPGGSVTGCPKISAMEEIDRVESASRGLYCGSVILLSDDGRLDSSIVIRSIERRGHELMLGVGGGIVADSTVAREYDETLRKAARILSLPVRRAWVNGRPATSHPALDPRTPGSRGVFETMTAERGTIRRESAHVRRLWQSAKHTGLHLAAGRKKEAVAQLHSALREYGPSPARVKIVLTDSDICIEIRPLDTDPVAASGIRVTVTDLDRAIPAAKALPYHREWRAYADAIARGYHESLLRRSDGTIPEAAVSNLFFVKKGTLLTADTGMLPGITRGRVLAASGRLRIPVRFVSPTLKDLLSADEIFLTRSTAGVIPVVRIGTHRIGRGRPGRITDRMSGIIGGA